MAAIHTDPTAFGYKTYYEEQATSTIFNTPSDDGNQPKFDVDEECFCGKEDFIIFAEFSEVMGPVPLLTIPTSVKDNFETDINNIILKIMSVDYHATPSGQFTFCKDVQVLQADVATDLHAYVHYCTLHDLGARGFVRPLCIAYLSSDLLKLNALLPTLREQFLKATEILQFNNRQWFMDELQKIISSLKEKQNIYFNIREKEEDGFELSQEEQKTLSKSPIESLVQQYTEYKNILHLAEPFLENNEKTRGTLSSWKGSLVSAEMTHVGVGHYIAKLRHELLNHGVGAGPRQDGSSLRDVVVLSPWGLSYLLWSLLDILRQHQPCRLNRPLPMFSLQSHEIKEVCNEKIQEYSIPPAERALQDPDFTKLLIAITHPVDNTDIRNKRCSQDSLDFLEVNFMTSGNEGSSSYHSAPESLSDAMMAVKCRSSSCGSSGSSHNSASSCESFIDVSEPDSWSDDSVTLSHQQMMMLPESFTFCVWGSKKSPLPNNVAGKNILKFFQSFPKAAHHVLYSMLIGRTVVLAGNEKSEKRVKKIINAVVALFPVQPDQEVKILRWHRGILVSSHIISYQIIGLCVPERISVHDMISTKDKNRVTILDVSTGQLFGPAYSGKLLASLENSPQHFQSDQTLLLFLQSLAIGIMQKVFLLRTSYVTPGNKSGDQESSPGDILREFGVHGCDAEIVKYLYKIGLGESI